MGGVKKQTHRRKKKPQSLTSKRTGVLVQSAKTRARKKTLPFNLHRYRKAIARRLAAGKCELSGIPLEHTRRWGPLSPSIHKKIPARGYVYSNILIVAFGLNNALGSWSFGEAEHLMMEASRGTPEVRKKRARKVRNLNRRANKFLAEPGQTDKMKI